MPRCESYMIPGSARSSGFGALVCSGVRGQAPVPWSLWPCWCSARLGPSPLPLCTCVGLPHSCWLQIQISWLQFKISAVSFLHSHVTERRVTGPAHTQSPHCWAKYTWGAKAQKHLLLTTCTTYPGEFQGHPGGWTITSPALN